MKKQLLLGSALLAAISAFPQTGSRRVSTKMMDMAQKVASKYVTNEPTPFNSPATPGKSVNQARSTAVASNTSSTWRAISGSENIYGMLVSGSRPLQYNDELGLVTFVHRKSHTYNASPLPIATASTGVIVTQVTNSWGQEWDSTCIWNNNTNWARYPQGGVYNPPGNTHAANAYIVGTGPVTQANTALGWVGNWFASKKLDSLHGPAYTNVAASQQYISNNSPFGPVGKADFVRSGFTVGDNGTIRAIGVLADDVNATGAAGYKGARIVKGTFNTGTNSVDWSGVNDSLIPPVRNNSATGTKQYVVEPHMAWNETGDVGYVWFIGGRTGMTGSNLGFQPVIRKTTDGGQTWSAWSGIDFNTPAMKTAVLDHLDKVGGTGAATNVKIPNFEWNEGVDGVVDMNNKLHLVGTIWAGASAHPDSVLASWANLNSVDNETYTWPHTPGRRPYIYDFIGDLNGAWNVLTVDSMSSENISSDPTAEGWSFNHWDATGEGGVKVGIDARIQASRTPDGKYVVITWAESDTASTTSQVKWNEFPNVKARMVNVGTNLVHPTEVNITYPENDFEISVRNAAFNHYASPKCALSTNSTPSSIAIILPLTISNNSELKQLEPVNHWYTSAILNFDNLETVIPPYGQDYRGYVGIAENALNSASNSVIYPNPARNNAVLAIDMKNSSKVEISVMNMVGQQVKSTQAEGQIGQNNINVDLNGLSSGIYMVNVKVGGASSTKKLIVE